ncbi:chemotaxis protein CheW [Halothiobacillus sp.]|uniref:chemotaxis protein CheW n=1 Tax=Halothiobacillus sp. TaxID=1891311 RepID=UPI002633365D|nr:chemotaxis protein CheW [Halothiobacillus sp.]MDD4965785.1 chemotaxis protein CheW [Halothiobacillus sp.]MDY0146913.1 chemotaxis protein CheW [Halothiobacillus sp.]
MNLFDYLCWVESEAAAHAVGMPKTDKVESTWQAVLFRAGGRRMLVPLVQVRAILPPPRQVRIPGAKPWVVGLANMRGELTGVYDLARLFFDLPSEPGRHSVVLLAKTQRFSAAFIVDRSYGIRQIPFSAERAVKEPHLQGVLREVRMDNDWLPILNLEALVESDQFMNAVA